MKTIVGSVIAAVGASACCLGPVVLSAMGAGALGAVAVNLEPLRPVLMVITALDTRASHRRPVLDDSHVHGIDRLKLHDVFHVAERHRPARKGPLYDPPPRRMPM
jgi:hypothetical protein